jgi:fibronectin type 3 domain-containing protein
MMISRKLLPIIVLGMLVVGFGCSRNISDPVSPPISDVVPETPFDLAVTIGDGTVALSWSIIDSLAELTYRVYVSDSTGAEYSVVGETIELSYTVGNLRNGNVYFFKVSSVNGDGFEGYKSIPVSAVPGLYGIIINDGDDFTDRRDVVLTLTAPDNTSLMQISDDSTFSGSQWESFLPSRAFRLASGDGVKTVYCRFRDASDTRTSRYFDDTIILDTHSFIDSLRFTPTGIPLSPGATVHFRLYAGETAGEGSVTIGDDILSLILLDNGQRGDAQAGDGIYELDYTIDANLDFENQIVYGNFIDPAGNIATPVQANATMTVRRPPDAVTIYSIDTPDGFFDRLQIAWSVSTAPDFAQYRIYRDTSAGVDSSDSLVRIITSSGTVTAIDTGLTENTRYYYRVYVMDNTGLWTGSDEADGLTGQNLPPDPVELYPPVATPGRHDRLELSWSQSNDSDFLRYELYRSYDTTVDSLDILLFISDSQTTFTDTGLDADSIYYYGVMARDVVGNISWSNTASGRTNVDDPPSPVSLLPVAMEPDRYQDVALEWNRSNADDFESYRLFRWQEDIGRADSALIFITTDIDVTSFMDHPPFNTVEDTINFWYILHLFDEGGNNAASDSIRVHLVDSDPPQASGSVAPSDSSLIVSWSPVDIPDFASYRLLRDTDPDTSGALTVFVTADQEMTTYTDESTVDDQIYYYWVDIYDVRNNSSLSLLGSGSW